MTRVLYGKLINFVIQKNFHKRWQEVTIFQIYTKNLLKATDEYRSMKKIFFFVKAKLA